MCQRKLRGAGYLPVEEPLSWEAETVQGQAMALLLASGLLKGCEVGLGA